MPAQDSQALASVYSQVAHSFGLGMLRFWEAKATGASLSLALIEYHSKAQGPVEDSPYRSTLEYLAEVPHSEFDSFRYLTTVSYLVYATTLLDTFLTDTTLFLFLLFPQAMGKNQQIPLSALLDAPQNEVLTGAAVKRAREISYLSFKERINFLRETFGLTMVLDEETERALEHYPTLRNSAVHDQGIFELFLDKANTITARAKTCPRHPSAVSGEDVSKAVRAYRSLAYAVGRTVLCDVLKARDEKTQRLLRLLAGEARQEAKLGET
jgi:hypothetical protein